MNRSQDKQDIEKEGGMERHRQSVAPQKERDNRNS